MSYSPSGNSLPDLTVTGFSAPAASWGGTLQVTVDVKNIGADTLPDPLSVQPSTTTPGASVASPTATSQPTTVAVFASSHAHSTRGEILIGSISIPAIPENDLEQFSQAMTLPSRPRGFPGDGGTIYLHYVVNPTRNFAEVDFTNNGSGPTPVLIEAPFPQLQAVALDVPPVMQPGDTIQPNIEVANLGPANTSSQGTFQVALVASVNRKFGPGSSVVALYTVQNIAGISTVATQSRSFGTANLDPQNNVLTINGAPVTLPTSPRVYYLGVVVDPNNQIKQLGKIGRAPVNSSNFSLIQRVGPPINGLPPAGVVTPGGGASNPQFPNPISTSTVGYGNLTGV